MIISPLFSLLVIAAGIVAAILVRQRCRREFLIREGCAGLLYDRGNLVGTLVSGRHVWWGAGYDVAVVDLRKLESAVELPAVESDSDLVLFAEPTLSIRKVLTDIRQRVDVAESVPKNSKLAGAPLRILLSEHSGPGGMLYESLRIRPAQSDHYY